MSGDARHSRTPPPVEAQQESMERLADFQESTKTILNGFFICIRMANLYDPSNEAFQKPMHALKSKLQEFLGREGELTVMFSEGQVYLNDIRLKVDSTTFEWVNGLVTFFNERDIGGFNITMPPSKEALFAFFQVLAKLPVAVKDADRSPRDLLIEALEKYDIREIVPLKKMALSEEDELLDEEKQKEDILLEAVGMYVTGLMAFKNLASGAGGAGNLLQLTRVVQSLADAEDKVGGDLLSLVTIKNCEHFILSHAMNVCILSMVMSKMLAMSKEDICDLAVGAMLHDIGKFAVRAGRKQFEEHPYESFKVVMGQGKLTHTLMLRGLIALDHHVSFDGKSGFPEFRLGQKPHLFARIVGIADAYDCLTTPTENNEPMLPDVAVRSMLKKGGTLFDPVLVQLFAEMLGKYPVGTLVELGSGDLGIVIKSGRGEDRLMRPIVLIVKDRYGNVVEGGAIVDLKERHPTRKAYIHSIVCSHDPERMGINASGYLIEFLTKKAEQKESAEG